MACTSWQDVNAAEFDSPERFFDVSPYKKTAADEWTAEIRPRAEFCCQAGAPSTDRICAGDSVFAVVIQGPSLLASGTVTNINEPPLSSPAIVATHAAAWTVRVRVPPIAGEYRVKTMIEMFNYPRMYDEWNSRQEWNKAMAALPSAELTRLYPGKFFHKALAVGGEQTVVVAAADVAAIPAPASKPWCTPPAAAEAAPPTGARTHLPGYWVGAPTSSPYFAPYDCRLRRMTLPALPSTIEGVSTNDVAMLHELAASESGADAVADLRARTTGKWIALFGDSNSRNLWAKLCTRLGAVGAQVVANITQLPEKDRPRDFVCYSRDLLLTINVWWPTNYPQLHDRLPYSAAATVAKSLVTSPDIPPALLAKAKPDRVLINLGSHDTHATVSLASLVRGLLGKSGFLPAPAADRSCGDGRIMFSTTVATDDTILIANKGMQSIATVQNNIRILRTNDGVRDVFGACAIADLYDVSEAPALAAWFTNAVHPPDSVYHAAVDVLLNYL